jgi:hypothetical protein
VGGSGRIGFAAWGEDTLFTLSLRAHGPRLDVRLVEVGALDGAVDFAAWFGTAGAVAARNGAVTFWDWPHGQWRAPNWWATAGGSLQSPLRAVQGFASSG